MANPTFRLVDSEVLGEQIAILLDLNGIDETLKSHRVIYRADEIDYLSQMGLSDETLQEVHKLKKAFKGWFYAEVLV